jgi:hypothetical protein
VMHVAELHFAKDIGKNRCKCNISGGSII